MTNSTKANKGYVVTVTETNTIVQLCYTREKPTRKRFPMLVEHLMKSTRHRYKVLVWSPNTYSKPAKYQWHKHGGYQGLNSTEICPLDAPQ